MPARSTAARIAAAPSCGAAKSFSSPWKAPMGVLEAETMTTGSFDMSVSSVSHMKVESLLGDFDPPGAVGPFLGEHEAVAFVEFACRIQARKCSEKNVAVPRVTAKIERDAHEPLAESRPAVSVVDDEKTQPSGGRRVGAVDGDAAHDFIVLGGCPEAVALWIEACKELSQLACYFRFEVTSETPIAGVIAAVQLDHAADASRHISADLHGASSRRLGKKLAPDQPAADLGSPRADLVELRVAPQAAGRRFVDIAHPAQALDRFACHPGGFFRGVEDRPGRVLTRGFVAVAGLTDGVDVGAARVERRVHVGEFSLHQLEFPDRLAELLALVNVGHDDVHARLHDAERPAREHGAFVVQARHQHVYAAARLREDIFLRHFAVLEHELASVGAAHAQLVELLSGGKSPEAFFDDESAAAVRDESVPAIFGPGFHRNDVRPRAGLGHGERADPIACDELRQIFELLSLAPVP